MATLKRTRVGLTACMRTYMRFQPTRLIKYFTTTWPRAFYIYFLIAMASLMRRQCVATVVPFATSLVFANVRSMALIMSLHMQFQGSLRLELLLTVWHLAHYSIWAGVQFRVAPQIVNRSESAITTFYLANVVFAFQVCFFVSFEFEFRIKCPGTSLKVALKIEIPMKKQRLKKGQKNTKKITLKGLTP